MATFMGDTRIVRREPFILEDLCSARWHKPSSSRATSSLSGVTGIYPTRSCPAFGRTRCTWARPRNWGRSVSSTEFDAEAREAHQQPEHGNPRVILEAISEGVVFTMPNILCTQITWPCCSRG